MAVRSSALAADPVQVEIISIEEEPGKMKLTLGVVGPDGKAATGLTAASFRASMDNVVLPVNNVEGNVPVNTTNSVLLLVDTSGSMYGEPMNQSRLALLDFVRSLDPGDQVAVMSFATRTTLHQDYTNDRALINAAINRLNPLGETALYDAVLEGAQMAVSGPEGRRLIVLLADGQANMGVDKRAASLAAASESGISIVIFGLGTLVDKQYLTELADASNGRFLEAPTAAVLRQAYSDLGSAIKSQYSVTLDVPASVDRTLAGKLSIHVSVRAQSGIVERNMGPLTGAVPLPFSLSLNGVSRGQRLASATTFEPRLPGDVRLTSVEYSLNGESVHTATNEPWGYSFDPALVALGNHVIKVTATDVRGRRGETQVQFLTVAPPEPRSIPWRPLLIIPMALVVGAAWFFWKRRPSPAESYATRLAPWSGSRPEAAAVLEELPEQPPPPPLAALPPDDRIVGRVAIMDENAMRTGGIDAIREFEMRDKPLVLGSGANVDIHLDDDGELIAAEEARLWVQKGRLVYHKLTTLSAMATEGVTSGWVFMESGETMELGPYRIVFKAEDPEPEVLPDEAASATATASETRIGETPAAPTQEHGMRLQPLWTRVNDDDQLSPSTDAG
jgi:Mg-chelatase subunit ChlD